VIMHMVGTPQTMQKQPVYADVVRDVQDYFQSRLHSLEHEGISPERIVFDPGFGFGKTLEHNISLMRALPRLTTAERPLLVGVSRKSMIARLIESDDLEDRDWPTVALTAHARELGARIVRVHDVKPNVQAMRMAEAILGDVAT